MLDVPSARRFASRGNGLASEVVEEATRRALALGGQLRRSEIGARARHELEALMKERPFWIGGAAFLLGVLLGGGLRRRSRRAPEGAEGGAAAPAPGSVDPAAASLSSPAPRRAPARDAVSGAIAGALATAPMTVVMTSLRRQLPGARRQEIPPRQITRAVARRARVAHALDAEQMSAATYGAHLGYGGALGAVYPAFATRLGGARASTGALFGLLVWGVSYLGWLPATGILRSAIREPAGRNGMMIGAHLVWGTATALLYDAARRRSPERPLARRSSEPPEIGGSGV